MQKKATGEVRIIAGKWRGRKLRFPVVEGLRPTPDRVRETLFNWLMPYIQDAVCLDLFAGSGALGFEALSRGAAHVVMVDENKAVCQALRGHADVLATNNATIVHASFPAVLSQLEKQRFNLVFLDPPFYQNLILNCIEQLETSACLQDDALIYVEAESSIAELPLPDHWQVLRQLNAGDVSAYFLRR